MWKSSILAAVERCVVEEVGAGIVVAGVEVLRSGSVRLLVKAYSRPAPRVQPLTVSSPLVKSGLTMLKLLLSFTPAKAKPPVA